MIEHKHITEEVRLALESRYRQLDESAPVNAADKHNQAAYHLKGVGRHAVLNEEFRDQMQWCGAYGIAAYEIVTGHAFKWGLVDDERRRQKRIWGDDHDDKHSTLTWTQILLDRLGKAAEAWHSDGAYKQRIIQFIATAVAAYEASIRQEETT